MKVIGLALPVALGIYFAPSAPLHMEDTTPPDWTYLPCSAFVMGSTIPPYTHTDMCIDTNGQRVAL